MKPPLLTTKELAQFLRVSLQTIYEWRLKGEGPPAVRIGKHLRFDSELVDAWLEELADSQRPPTQPGSPLLEPPSNLKDNHGRSTDTRMSIMRGKNRPDPDLHR